MLTDIGLSVTGIYFVSSLKKLKVMNKTEKNTVRVEMLIHAPAAAVWKALTDPVEVKKYFFGTDLVTDWEVGQPIYFRGEWDGKAYEDKGTVLDYRPLEKLEYDYFSSLSGKEDKPENYQTISYTVEPKGGDTLLTITQANAGSVEQQEHSEQNWKMVMGEMKKLVEN